LLLDVQRNTFGYPTQAGQAVLGFLGYLHAAYGYRTFDLVGYSYGGVVARATVAALKQQAAPASMAPAFSYATAAVRAGIRIPSVTTLNSPHLGSPTYDIASDPRAFYGPVASAWGTQFAEAGMGLVPYGRDGGAGSIHVLKTDAHAKPDPTSWDAQQVGVLDGVALTLIAGNYCGRSCGDANTPPDAEPKGRLRTDGTVPVYSQLMQPCTAACLAPPMSCARRSRPCTRNSTPSGWGSPSSGRPPLTPRRPGICGIRCWHGGALHGPRCFRVPDRETALPVWRDVPAPAVTDCQ
jgi:hypothetical protein